MTFKNLTCDTSAIVAAIAESAIISIVYQKPNGIVNVRAIRPYALSRCKNGNTTVRATCVHQGEEPRQFSLNGIMGTYPGNILPAIETGV